VSISRLPIDFIRQELIMNDTTHTPLPDEDIHLADAERQRCEVWTRVMGYHRPVASFNIGKKGEHYERRFFQERRIEV
jgi:Anaerobic ribonucleoside-triphosphate reductase